MASSEIFSNSSRWELSFHFPSASLSCRAKKRREKLHGSMMRVLEMLVSHISTRFFSYVNVRTPLCHGAWAQEVKGFREEIGESLNRIENRVVTISERDRATRAENGEHLNGIKRLGEKIFKFLRELSFNLISTSHINIIVCEENEIEKLKYQTSDDMNDCVKYISTINDKINQIAVMRENQHNFAE